MLKRYMFDMTRSRIGSRAVTFVQNATGDGEGFSLERPEVKSEGEGRTLIENISMKLALEDWSTTG